MYVIWLRFKLWIKSFQKQDQHYDHYIYEEDDDK